MDRLHDYNFGSDSSYTNDHYTHSGTLTHAPLYQQSNSLAQAPFATNTVYDQYPTRPEQQHQTSIPQFRLPSLAPLFDFDSDSQLNVPLVRPALPTWQMYANDGKPAADTSAPRPGTHPRPLLPPIASLTLPMPLLLPSPVPNLLPPAYSRAPQYSFLHGLDPSFGAPSRQHESGASTSSLSLADICHIEDSNPLVTPNSGEHSSIDLPMSLDEPYSACPATEFSAPSCSPPLFVPALSYDSLGGSEGSCTTSPKREFEDEFLCFSPTLGSVEEDIFGPAPLLGIYADVNMRERAVQELPLSACVNPLDVMGYVSDGSIPEPDCKTSWDEQATLPTGHSTPASDTRSQAQSPMEQRLSHTPDFTTSYPEDLLVKADFPEDAISAIVSILKSSVKQEPPESTGVIQPCEVHAPQPQYPNHALANISNDVGVHHPSLAYNPCGARVNFPGPRMPFADLQRQNIQQIQVPQSHQPDALSRGLPEQLLLSPTTPVLNAHTGIELDELRRRAVETRTRHPNAELDKSFLQCFAGRLSERGELLDEYRCYVVGCGQRNKRRDHILVHVGSHVEHRPWQCQHCGMRFLRKNECKRHESSHEGRKPFSCQICAPYQERNFVRQDLLKRHMRVTHGVNDTSRTTASSRKRQQARENENMEDWP